MKEKGFSNMNKQKMSGDPGISGLLDAHTLGQLACGPNSGLSVPEVSGNQ